MVKIAYKSIITGQIWR